MPVAVGFDLDHTLAVTARDRTALLRQATEAADAPPISREAYLDAHAADLATETREPIFAELLTERDSDVDPATLTAAYRRHIEDALEPVPGAVSLLTGLREAGYRVGLLTDGPVRAQRGKLERLGWAGLFDTVVVTGELPAGKPDRRAFEALLDGLGVDPADLVYVGDHPRADIGGAAAMGIRAIQVCYDGGPDPDPRATTTVERDHLATEVPAILRGLE